MTPKSPPRDAAGSDREAKLVELRVDDSTVSGLWLAPPEAVACLVVAHGAGAGMRHPFLAGLAAELASRGIATLRYQFPYMDAARKRPDTPPVCHATVRAAVAAAERLAPELPLFAGGKSFGGRMTSQAQALNSLPGVRGLVFLGFPLHPPQQPSAARGDHLTQVDIPMLFLQGSRDAFAEPPLLQPLVARLGRRATLCELPGADHSFRVPARGVPTQAQTDARLLEALVEWIRQRRA